MLELRSQKIFPFLTLCFFFHFSSISSATFTYSLPDQYFVNCGSGSDTEIYGKTFVGDENHVGFSLSSGNNSPVEDLSPSSVDQLYQSARIFRKRSWYEFNIEQNGTFVVRFHFLPFPTLGNVSDARFSVLASGFSLLSQFTVEKTTNLLPHIEEFLTTITAGKFKVYFVPDDDNSFAFVNAIEVFLAPPGFIPISAPHVTREGRKEDDYNNLLSFPLRVIHRINVGGKNIMPNNDTLLRSWIPDDPYLFNRGAAKDSVPYGYRPQYQISGAGATEFDAPAFVYKTAKQMNIDNNNNSTYIHFNITWRFPVRKGAKHLLRVHFCDIVSTSYEGLRFNLYIYSKFNVMIWPYDVISQLAAPFYRDYQVDSDDSGFINVSVGTKSDSPVKNAFLNGVEIMQLIENTRTISEGGSKHLFIVIGSVLGSAIVLIMILVLVLFYLKRRKLNAVEAFDRPLVPYFGGISYSRTTDRTLVGSPFADLNLSLKLHLTEILYATKNFDTRLMIGEGGFGKVYKGTLRDGTKVAIKRSEPGSCQGLPEFQTEIMVLSKIRHNHLVSLIGYCDERDEMILVYECMEKGALRDHLYKIEDLYREETAQRSKLSWDQRVRICVGAAKGIHYLHTGSSGVVIHRDIKSTNILLDEHYVAKVSDFGLSTSGPLDQTHVSTEVKGSFGYLDPEYFKFLQLTQKSDVYSFGVVLLEVLCARPVVDQSSRGQVSLVDWGMSWIKKGQIQQIVDPHLEGKINPDSLRKFGETVEKCLQEYGADRPNMVDVLWDLEYCLQLQQAVAPREPYEDSTTDVGLPMPVIQRLPSHNIPTDEDESYSFTNTSQVNAGEVFSLLKTDEAR